MTETHIDELERLARAATPEPHHIYTHPRDDNNWRANNAWHEAASPQVFMELIERVRAADADLFAARQALITEGMSRDSYGLKLIEMRADRDRLAAQNAELVAALEVFVDATKTWPMIVLTQGDIDRARAALAIVKAVAAIEREKGGTVEGAPEEQRAAPCCTTVLDYPTGEFRWDSPPLPQRPVFQQLWKAHSEPDGLQGEVWVDVDHGGTE